MKAIIIMDLQGFTPMANTLAVKMDKLKINQDRIRAISIQIVEDIIKDTNEIVRPLQKEYIGGDSWAFIFQNVHDAVGYGCFFLRRFSVAAYNQGLFYLKPAIALNTGTPVFKDGKFIDNDSIAAYTIADKGYPYEFYVHPQTINLIESMDYVSIMPPEDPDSDDLSLCTPRISWQDAKINFELVKNTQFDIPSLLIDTETFYSDNAEDAINLIIRQQRASKNAVHVFGGPVPIGSSFYDNYLRETISIISKNESLKWTVISYIPINDPLTSYAWIELARRIKIEFPKRFNFTAFSISDEQLRPFSFQIFDYRFVHVGLRKYSPESGTPVMSSAVMFNNKRIAKRFYDEFVENWRMVGEINEKKIGDIVSSINGVTDEIKTLAHKRVREILG